MQALVDRVPSRRAGGAEKRASVTSKILDLPGLTATPESQHFIPVSRHGLRARLIAMLKEDGGGSANGTARSIASPPGATNSIASACSS
jgi:hypothetical protein